MSTLITEKVGSRELNSIAGNGFLRSWIFCLFRWSRNMWPYYYVVTGILGTAVGRKNVAEYSNYDVFAVSPTYVKQQTVRRMETYDSVTPNAVDKEQVPSARQIKILSNVFCRSCFIVGKASLSKELWQKSLIPVQTQWNSTKWTMNTIRMNLKPDKRHSTGIWLLFLHAWTTHHSHFMAERYQRFHLGSFGSCYNVNSFSGKLLHSWRTGPDQFKQTTITVASSALNFVRPNLSEYCKRL